MHTNHAGSFVGLFERETRRKKGENGKGQAARGKGKETSMVFDVFHHKSNFLARTCFKHGVRPCYNRNWIFLVERHVIPGDSSHPIYTSVRCPVWCDV